MICYYSDCVCMSHFVSLRFYVSCPHFWTEYTVSVTGSRLFLRPAVETLIKFGVMDKNSDPVMEIDSLRASLHNLYIPVAMLHVSGQLAVKCRNMRHSNMLGAMNLLSHEKKHVTYKQ
jgi:hypothetical protein